MPRPPSALLYRFVTLEDEPLTDLIDALISVTRVRDDGSPTEVCVPYPSAFWSGAALRRVVGRYRDLGWFVDCDHPEWLAVLRAP